MQWEKMFMKPASDKTCIQGIQRIKINEKKAKLQYKNVKKNPEEMLHKTECPSS